VLRILRYLNSALLEINIVFFKETGRRCVHL